MAVAAGRVQVAILYDFPPSSRRAAASFRYFSSPPPAITYRLLRQPRKAYGTQRPFDTYRLVTQLEEHGFTRGQAEVIMEAMSELLTHGGTETRRQMLDKDDLENERYLFRAALDELRTEIEVLRRTDHATLKAESDTVARDVDVLTQRLREGIATLRQENQVVMNSRKLEQRADEKEMDVRVQDLNDQLMVKLGEVRTQVEAMKMAATRNAMVMVFWTGALVMVIGYMIKKNRQQAEADARRSKLYSDPMLIGEVESLEL
ncbi:hypothetical protein THASP1DRAFT_22869 [Thamnocephalis sphaerospora]|uniref:DUF1640-domain-containing protein n=1 Tax=Thamnocephalis sphaerospora TaxID=78915 RepID=A0A4P9XUK1_9FUNG|nr:hypothetical protein THASP1DRAFT_22869 [Thamnocephalis sphaerospora]|eukprot:RKP09261.1 hypothetical protein THASP1DRAFT_22869 [Thamnocephalis sphaerospora]